jgi:hypothetical protein
MRTATMAAHTKAKSSVLDDTGRDMMWVMVCMGSHSFVTNDAGNIVRPVAVVCFKVTVQFLQGFI